MVFLFIQTWIWLLAAALLGLLIGWLLWHKEKSSDESRLVQRRLEECRRRCAELESGIPENPVEQQSAGLQVSAKTNRSSAATSAGDASASPEFPDLWRPNSLPEPAGKADDLKQISGIGPIIEKTLNGLGVFHFRQIEALTVDNVKWINNYLGFSGRVEREDWIEQARQLSRDSSISEAELHDGNGENHKGEGDKGETPVS